MRRRGIKKLALGAKKNMTPIRQMRTTGKKKLRRRLKAWKRAGKAMRKEEENYIERIREALSELQGHEPKTPEEATEIAAFKKWARETIRKHRQARKRKQEVEESFDKLRTLMAAVHAAGGMWPR